MTILQAVGVGLYFAGHGTALLPNGTPVGPICMILGGILFALSAFIS